jgi:Ankyrin repeats (3 copies)
MVLQQRIWDQELRTLLESSRLADLRLAATIAMAFPHLLTIEEREALRRRGQRITQATLDLRDAAGPCLEGMCLHALSGGADVEAIDLNKGVPFLCTIAMPPRHTMRPDAWHDDRRARVARALLDAGANVNAVDPHTGRTALHYAASWNVPKLVKTLLQHGADPMFQDSMGEVPAGVVRRNFRRLCRSVTK